MEYKDGFVSKDQRKLVRSLSESADPLTVSALQISTSPKSPRSPKSYSKHGSSRASPSKGSPRGSPRKNDRRQHSPRDGRPKKGT